MTTKLSNSITFLVTLILLNSCVSNKKLAYLQNIKINDTISMVEPSNLKLTLSAGDNLRITFYNSNPEINNLLNNGKTGQTLNSNMLTTMYFSAFSINDSGFVDIPVIGMLNVMGKTIKQTKSLISNKINQIFSETFVNIHLTERQYTLLGEFNKPGNYSFNKNKVTLFQAIGTAGDITEYGNRKKIKIIRQFNGKAIIKHIDITDKNFVNSPNYYLQNNDIIYIEPLKAKTFQTRTFPVTSILSIITSVLVILNFVNK